MKDGTHLVSWHLFLLAQISFLNEFVIKSILNVFNINKKVGFHHYAYMISVINI